MMLSFTSFYSSSLWAQAAPCTCPTGWATSTHIIFTICGAVEVNVCCTTESCSGPYTMILCNVTTPVGFCTPPTTVLFQQITDALIDINPCGFPCNEYAKIWEITGPCRAKNSLININGVYRNVIEWAENPCDEPCRHRYNVTCIDGIITKTLIDHVDESCKSITTPPEPGCYNVCK